MQEKTAFKPYSYHLVRGDFRSGLFYSKTVLHVQGGFVNKRKIQPLFTVILTPCKNYNDNSHEFGLPSGDSGLDRSFNFGVDT